MFLPTRSWRQLADGPAARITAAEDACERDAGTVYRPIRRPGCGCHASEDRRREGKRKEGQTPVDFRDSSDDGHADDPGGRRPGEGVGDEPRAVLRLAPRRSRCDARCDEHRDARPHRYLRKAEELERRGERTRERPECEENGPSQQKRPRREPSERATGRERNDGCERRGDEAKLPGTGDGDVELFGNVRQNR